MYIIFEDKFVEYNQIFDVPLIDINDFLLEKDVEIDLDNDYGRWAGFAYYYCDSQKIYDKKFIGSFVFIISLFMTGTGIDIFDFESKDYYNNSFIFNECLEIYKNTFYEYDSEIDLCKVIFLKIFDYYVDNNDEITKKNKRINVLLSYKELELFDEINGSSRSDKFRVLLDYYYQ